MKILKKMQEYGFKEIVLIFGLTFTCEVLGILYVEYGSIYSLPYFIGWMLKCVFMTLIYMRMY